MGRANILYLPHGGGPLPLLDESGNAAMNRFLREFPRTIDRPDAIVVFSAHWEQSVIGITAAEKPALLFDYYGFPPDSYRYRYPAPGAPHLAERARALLQNASIEAILEKERGLDHGVFVPLMLMYPDADIPCIQISLSSSLDAGLHLRIGRALADLKPDNLLFLGSGFSFHNMDVFMGNLVDSGGAKNRVFETWLAQTCSDQRLTEAEREARLIDWEMAPQARFCHPREEHLLPLQVCYGLGQSAARTVFQEPVAGGVIASAYQW